MTQPDIRRGIYSVPAKYQAILRALLSDGEDSRNAFSQWAGKVDFDAIDYRTQTLMPALYDKMAALGVSHPLLPRMKSLYAYFFTKTALLLSGIGPVLRAFNEAGIDLLLLKGAAEIARFDLSPGIRPMSDIDILLHPDAVEQALRIAEEHGFRAKFSGEQERLMNAPHSYDLLNEKGLGLDLHVYAARESMYPDCDNGLWERAIPSRFLGYPVFVPSPEDGLVHLCVNGTRELCFGAREPQGLLWISDAARLLGTDVRWEQAAEAAEERGVSYNVLCAAKIIRRIDQRLVPPEGILALETNLDFLDYLSRSALALSLDPVRKRRELLAFQINSYRPGFFNLGYKWTVHHYEKSDLSFLARAVSFPGFLRRSWGLEKTGQMPGYILKMLWKKLKKGDRN